MNGCSFTLEEYDLAATNLVQILSSSSCNNNNSPSQGLEWSLRSTRRAAGAVLEHAPIIRRMSLLRARIDDNDDGDESEASLLGDDESVWVDGDTAVVATSNKDTAAAIRTVWNLSVVYSETWRVPVLYFTVQTEGTGSPCARPQVVEMLQSCHPTTNRTSTTTATTDDDCWDFVSATEHPVHGTPCFFLHPCRTSERLQVLQQQHQQSGTFQNPTVRLWSWFSLLLPSVGLSIPPRLFLQVQKQLQNEKKRK